MDRLSLLGLLLAVVAVVGGHYLEGGQLQQLFNPPALLIVVGGTLAAAAIQSPADDFRRALRLLRWLLRSPRYDFEAGVKEVVRWCGLARKDGLLALEKEVARTPDPLVRGGLQLLVDGRRSEVIRAMLEVQLVAHEQRDLQGARVIESMGGYAPTLGILGAVIGLIQVMSSLADPEGLGAGIATAFVATVYGVGLANLLLIPLANKIKNRVLERYRYQEMMLEGLLSIADGQSPQLIRQRLLGYLG
ncbi:flagellar motor protein [Marinobacterium nitratireducens]|uniref:Flagellar motor protein n=1 Tax=Marinobacterium nitratireducens TaxID=518897 RepID=A0A917ZMB2_9GAMM|nr:flagellar motor protein [Marinobacterium nitratireducens]GGO85043.1 flagellar motor protein [Marinobacterium nitratireducens]